MSGHISLRVNGRVENYFLRYCSYLIVDYEDLKTIMEKQIDIYTFRRISKTVIVFLYYLRDFEN